MKPYHFIAPILALVAGAIWISLKETALTDLEKKTQIITERIQLLENSTAGSPAGGSAAASTNKEKTDEFTLPDGSLNWEMIAELVAEAESTGGMPTNMKTMLKLRQKFMLMTEEEIEDGLVKIRALDLPKNTQKQLTRSLYQMMSQKNPRLALELLADQDMSNDSPYRWIRTNAFDKIASEDPAAALAWLDQQVKDGNFQSKALDPGENPQLRLESTLMGRLAGSDLAAVKARLATFSPAERHRILSDNHRWIKDGKMPESYLEVARENLTEEQASSAIANAWTSHSRNKLPDIGKHLEEIPFTDQERQAVVKQALNNAIHDSPSGKDYNNIYEWAKEYSPEQANAMVAQSLASRSAKHQLEENFEKSLELAETFNDPGVATEFVEQYAKNHSSFRNGTLPEFKNPETAAKLKAMYEALPKEDE